MLTTRMLNGGSASYAYDDMNRLSGATLGSLNLSWTYDRYGNRWGQGASGTWPRTVSQPSLSFSSTTNQVTSSGYAYDVAGNLMQDPLHTYTYDAEGNVTAIDGGSTASYTYDANNQRVEAITPAGTQEFGFNAGGQRATVWDGNGNLVSAQYGGVAYYLAADGHVRFEHDDWTGTERMRTTDTGTVDASFLSLPFGDGLQTVQGTDTDPYHFAGLDQDAQNIEHAAFRELSSVQGRWLRPDPYDGSYNFFDPQSMNRYAYVENTPVSAIDPSGLQRPGTQVPGCWGYDDMGQPCDPGDTDGGDPTGGDPTGGDPSGGDPSGGDPGGGGFGLGTGGSIGLGNGGVSTPSGLGFGSYGLPAQGNEVPSNPCEYMGNAMSPSAYANAGKAVRGNPFALYGDTHNNFRKGHLYDAQTLASGTIAQKAAYGNYVYGVYMQAAGVPLVVALSAANYYAAKSSQYPVNTQMADGWPMLPAINVANITNGFNAQMGGTTCHR